MQLAVQDVDAAEEQRIKQVRMAVTRRIQQLGRAGKAREAVQQLAEMARLGVQPDSMLGTALIDACARSGHMQMAQAAFEELFGAQTPEAAAAHCPGCLKYLILLAESSAQLRL